ncbi:MAG TPA: sensor histidine kinase [Rariglobus sp.]|nr:sensor histidine kinase [Rariglobus sp.]
MRAPRLFCLLLSIPVVLWSQEPLRYPTAKHIIEVYADQTQVPISSSGPEIDIPADTQQVRFLVSPKPGRVRYQLERTDKGWQQRVGLMYFGVRFYNQKGDQVSQETFLASGKSDGWNGSLENSTFSQRREVLTVPPKADHLAVFMSSAGPSSSVGIFAISKVKITRTTASGDLPAILMSSPPFFQEGQDSLTSAPGWLAGGIHPSMAEAITLRGPAGPLPALAIVDNDITAHADWYTPNQNGPQVIPGETLIVQWDELYNNGMGDPLWASYDHLAPGSYRFSVQDVSLSGQPLPEEYSVRIRIPLPYWKNPWFWSGCIAAAIALATLIGRHLVQANIRSQLERARLIEQERMRIARDLHDDLGARLSHISLASSHAENNSSNDESRGSFREITEMAQELATSLSETVWMLNPKNDHLESLVDFLCRMVSTLCKPTGVSCRIDAVPLVENISVSNEVRHHISLTVKEAVTNALKHSGATEIRFSIHADARALKITIADNGAGLPPAPAQDTRQGNGMANMSQRMASINGHFGMETQNGKGTTITLEIPLD